MAVRFNTAKQNALAGTGVAGLVRLRLYSGPQPPDANLPPSGVHLATIEFIVWGTPAAGVVSLNGTFPATALATGTPGWGRFDNGIAATLVMDAAAGIEFTVTPPNVIAGAPVTLTNAALTQPPG